MTDLATRIADVKKKAEAAKATARDPWPCSEDRGDLDFTEDEMNFVSTASPDLFLAMAAEIEALTAKLQKAREATRALVEAAYDEGFSEGAVEFLSDTRNGKLFSESAIAARVSEELKN